MWSWSWWWLLFRYQKKNGPWKFYLRIEKMASIRVSIRQISGLMKSARNVSLDIWYIPNQQKLPLDFLHKEGFTPIEFPSLSIQKSLPSMERFPCPPVVVAWHESLTPQLPGWKQRDLSLWRIPRSPPRRAKRPVTSAFHWRQRYREMRRWEMQIVCVYHNS